MSKKIGHNYEREPYPWDTSKKLASASEWTCCDMNLPATFYICPICEKERGCGAGAGTLIADDTEDF